MPTTPIAETSHYRLAFNPEKNRIYFWVMGYWKKADDVPFYIRDWEKAIRLSKPGFTLLGDMSEMITHPQDIRALHELVMGKLQKAGVSKVGEIASKDKIAMLQTAAMAQAMQLRLKSFQTQEEAESWLNSAAG